MVRARILVVEDEQIVALNIQRRLAALGYAIVANLPSAEEAIEAAQQTAPDLVLMDIKLPGEIDGIEAARQIRNRFQIPVVYLTAYTDDDTLERAKLTEPYGYILKPFDARSLCSTIEVALYKHQMEQQLRERMQFLETTLKSMGDAVITTDQNGLVTFMNPMAEALTCWQLTEVLGSEVSHVFQTINEQTREVLENPVALVLQEGITVELESDTLLITKDGREIPIDDSAAPIKTETGNILGSVLVFHDIIERQQMAVFLRQTNQALEARVATSLAQLRQTNKQLRAEIRQRQRLENELRVALAKEQELNDIKSRIVALISHEYRTPLTTILSSAELLERYGERLTDQRKQEHLTRIKSSGLRMTKLVNDMLFIEQAEAGSLELNLGLVNVERFTREVVENLILTTEGQRTIELECRASNSSVVLDEKLFELILTNLLTNALKYSPESSAILLELEVEQSEILVRVSDNGIGIPLAEQQQVFDAFFRGSNIGIVPGMGLGLLIVKECVNLHGGTITLESQVGIGTTITVKFPRLEQLTGTAKAED